MKKGFTLIELLAVIVILAIIAIIAVPIVIDIIAESKGSSGLINAEFYLDALELSIANSTLKEKNIQDGEYNILSSGNVCLEYEDDNITCKNDLTVELKGDSPNKGKIIIQNGTISDVLLHIGKNVIVKNDKGELVYRTLSSLCTYNSGSAPEKTIGAKYSCNFGGGTRNFYILELGSNPITNSTLKENEVALLLEGNYDETTQNYCDQKGSNKANATLCKADGLIEKLDEISDIWLKLDRSQITIPSVSQIVAADGRKENSYLSWITLTNAWLYNWPDNASYSSVETNAYWTSTPRVDVTTTAWNVFSNGRVSTYHVANNYNIRPVVNIEI